MAAPATTGVLRTKVSDMEIGDYIACKYVATANAVGTFSELGTSVATEIALTGSNVPNGTFYFVKTAKGMIVSDRVVQHSFTWDAMNTGKIVQGKPTTLGTTEGAIRSLTGGVAYADANGNKSTSDAGAIGAWPTNNEWDSLVLKFPTDLIQSGKTLNDVFHWNAGTFCQDTPSEGLLGLTGLQGKRFYRGTSTPHYQMSINSSQTSTNIGFRPVFEFNEA